MRATERFNQPQRGVIMLIVVVLVALLIIVALIVASGAFNAQTSAAALGVKYRVLNSAEAGANFALNELAENARYGSGQCVNGTLNGKPYEGCVEVNNLPDPQSTTAIDPETGTSVTVPGYSAYIYGESSFQGARKVYIEAIADPSPPLTLPGGAINAQGDVDDQAPEPISQDPANPGDANVNANGNINVSGGSPSTVQGATSAVGTNQLPGTPQTSGAGAIAFPNQVQLQQAAQNAQSIAQVGTQVTGASLSSGSGGTLSGDAYVNGDIQLSKGTITFSNGSYVYVNGNVCVSGSGALSNLNTGHNVLVVSGVMAVTGTGQFTTVAQQNSLLLVMGADPTTFNPCGAGPYALDLEPGGSASPIGTVYAGAGSVYLGGQSALTGAVDAEANAYIGGSPSSAFHYDSAQVNTTITTGTLTYSAYNEY